MRTDLDLSFKTHPLTGDLAIKTESSAIRQSLVNIVRTNYYDRGMNVNFGTNIESALFENITYLTAVTIKTNIMNAIKNYEYDIDLIDVQVIDNGDNDIDVKVYYTELNRPNVLNVVIPMTRIR